MRQGNRAASALDIDGHSAGSGAIDTVATGRVASGRHDASTRGRNCRRHREGHAREQSDRNAHQGGRVQRNAKGRAGQQSLVNVDGRLAEAMSARERNGGLMNGIIKTAFYAAIATAASWAVREWLDGRYTQRNTGPRKPPIETWENEGGALAPHHVAAETSQVPR
jgi:hypothetical protein